MTAINRNPDRQALAYLDWQTSALPYYLAKPEQVLVLGAGGGAEVQQALNYAVDKQAIIKKLIGPGAQEAVTLLTDRDFGYTSAVKPYPYDPKMARKLLSDAGFPNGFSIKLDAMNGRYINDSAVVQAIAGYLDQVGVKVVV